MRRRDPLPSLILMTDERLGEALWPALAALPRGAGVIFRDYALPSAERRARFDRVRRIACHRRLVVLLAGSPTLCAAWHADGCHGRDAVKRHVKPMLRSMSVHSRRELVSGRRASADLLLVSPIFATRSHPGARSLGRIRAGLLLGQGSRYVIVALGGMTSARSRSLRSLGISRWAAIDGLRSVLDTGNGGDCPEQPPG